MGNKMSPNNSPVVCDGYVKFDEAEVDRLVAILKTNNCCGGGGPCGIQYAARLSEGCLMLLFYLVNINFHSKLSLSVRAL